MNDEKSYYPLTPGNTWTFDFGGKDMITKIESMNDAGEYVTSNSLNPQKGVIKKVDGEYFDEAMDKSGFNLILKDNLSIGDKWQCKFKAPSGLDTIYIYTVKEIFLNKIVEGKEYKDVAMVELDSLYEINGVATSMNAFTQTYYAKGVGPILITTSGIIGNSSSPLKSCELK